MSAHDRHEPEGPAGNAEMRAFVAGWFAHARNPEDARLLVEDAWHAYRLIESTAPDSTPTEREARVRFPKSVGNATVDMETIQPTEREAGDVGEIAAVLAAHADCDSRTTDGMLTWVFGCGIRIPAQGFADYAAIHRAHLADALAPLIAERERAAGARALREAAEDYFTLMTRTEPGGTPEWLRERADALAPEPD